MNSTAHRSHNTEEWIEESFTYAVTLAPEKPIGTLFYRDVMICDPNGVHHLLHTLYIDPSQEFIEMDHYDYESIQGLRTAFVESEGRFTRYAGHNSPFKLLEFMVDHEIAKFVGSSIVENQHEGVSYWDVRGSFLNCRLPFWYRFFEKRSLDVWVSLANQIDSNIKL